MATQFVIEKNITPPVATNSDFTIADVLAWARTKPADEEYQYYDSEDCALCQFLKETRRAGQPLVKRHREDQEGSWRDGSAEERPYPAQLEPALASQKPMTEDLWGHETFGALVKRLEKLCPETIVTRDDWTRLDAYLTDIEAVAVSA